MRLTVVIVMCCLAAAFATEQDAGKWTVGRPPYYELYSWARAGWRMVLLSVTQYEPGKGTVEEVFATKKPANRYGSTQNKLAGLPRGINRR